MTNSLRSALDSLATSFAASVLDAIRSASLQELLTEAGGARRSTPAGGATARARKVQDGAAPKRKTGRLARRSPADIQKALTRVQQLLHGRKDGLRSEQIQKALGLDKRELPRVLKTGLKAKQLRSKGRKRATTYFAG